MVIPDIRVGAPIERTSERTGKPLKPIQYVWHAGACCGELTAMPLKRDGHARTRGATCPFCGGKR